MEGRGGDEAEARPLAAAAGGALLPGGASPPSCELPAAAAAAAVSGVIHLISASVSGCSLPLGDRSTSSASGSGERPGSDPTKGEEEEEEEEEESLPPPPPPPKSPPTGTPCRRSSGSGKSRFRSTPAAFSRLRRSKPSGLTAGARWSTVRERRAATRGSEWRPRPVPAAAAAAAATAAVVAPPP